MCLESPAVFSFFPPKAVLLSSSHPPGPGLYFLLLLLSSSSLFSLPQNGLPLLPSSSTFLSSQFSPLSVSPIEESMILLGSIERAQLQSLLSQQLGHTRRLEYIRERAAAEKKRLSVMSNPGSEDESQRVSQEVRFQVRVTAV